MKKRSEKLIEEIAKLVEKCKALDCKTTKDFIKLIQANAEEINLRSNTAFVEMVRKRQAARYAGKTEEQFKAEMQKMIDEQKAIFDRSRKLTAEDIKEIEAMKKKAATARRKNVGGVSIDDLMK